MRVNGYEISPYADLTDADLPLPVTQPQPAPLVGLTTRFYDIAFTAKQFWNSF